MHEVILDLFGKWMRRLNQPTKYAFVMKGKDSLERVDNILHKQWDTLDLAESPPWG